MTITPRGVALLVGSVLLWLLGRTLGTSELFAIGVAAAALVGASALAIRLSTATISVRRVVGAPRLPAGGSTDVTVGLRNDGRLPASLALVEDECHPALRPGAGPIRFAVAGLAPGRTTTVRYLIHGGARGRYTVGPLKVRLRDPFGLVERVRRHPSVDEVIVHPLVELLPEGIARGNHHGSRTSDTRRLFGSGDEFYALRDYATGDDLRQVHWPSSARRAKLMVRQHELPWQRDAVVFCDVRDRAHRGSGPASTLEKAISVSASLVRHLADHRYELRLITDADERRSPQARRGPEDVGAMLDRLADVAASDNDSIAPALQRLRSAETGGLLAAVIAPPPGDLPVPRHPDVQALLAAGKRFGARLAVVVDDAGGRAGDDAGGRAGELARLLGAAGWHTTLVHPREALAERWPEVLAARPAAPHGTAGSRR